MVSIRVQPPPPPSPLRSCLPWIFIAFWVEHGPPAARQLFLIFLASRSARAFSRRKMTTKEKHLYCTRIRIIEIPSTGTSASQLLHDPSRRNVYCYFIIALWAQTSTKPTSPLKSTRPSPPHPPAEAPYQRCRCRGWGWGYPRPESF